MFRLFVGIPLPAEVRARLAVLCAGLPGAKWVAADNLHLTLCFIGEVGHADAEDIHEALGRVHGAPFTLTLTGTGCFGTGRKVRALWVGIAREDRLMRLQDKVETAIVRCGHTPERRKFKPHITLARFKGGISIDRIGAFMERNNTFAAGPIAVDSFTLFRSHLGGEGAHYETLAAYPFGTTALGPATANEAY